MTQKEKQLLLKDLCARLAYNPFCKVNGIGSPVKLIRVEVDTVDGILLDFDYKNEQGLPLQVYLSEVKPYLRLMSSMTKEEEKEYAKVIVKSQDCSLENSESATTMANDWLLSKGFDVRGLISKGLALEAPENFYNN